MGFAYMGEIPVLKHVKTEHVWNLQQQLDNSSPIRMPRGENSSFLPASTQQVSMHKRNEKTKATQ